MSRRPRILRALAPWLVAASFGACDGATIVDHVNAAPLVKTASSSVAPGGVVSLRLISQSQQSWDYGACSYQVDRLESGEWVMVDNPLLGVCTLQVYSLRAGDEDPYDVRVPNVNGTYRIRFRFVHVPDVHAEGVWVTSNRFMVGATTLPD